MACDLLCEACSSCAQRPHTPSHTHHTRAKRRLHPRIAHFKTATKHHNKTLTQHPNHTTTPQKPQKGVKCLLEDEAVLIGGANHSHATQDLTEAIAAGDYPEWTLFVQTLDLGREGALDFDPLDVTKVGRFFVFGFWLLFLVGLGAKRVVLLSSCCTGTRSSSSLNSHTHTHTKPNIHKNPKTWPEDVFPLQPVGRMVLNRNIDNFFNENEQLAFCPALVVPGERLMREGGE